MFLIKAAGIAFSMFSIIPVPQFEWKEKEMKYMIAFFPLVGVVIGITVYLWTMLCQALGMSKGCLVLIGTALPIVISGGIHVDGYMDTMDALHSYRDRERKLEILKDAHVGAFSVILLIVYYLIYIGAYLEIEGMKAAGLLASGFYLSRILSGIGAVTFACARIDGLLYTFSSSAQKRLVRILLYLQLAVCGGTMIFLSKGVGTAAILMSLLTFLYYWKKSKKEFGGVTGDTSGYFTVLCEGVIMLTIAIGCKV